MVNFEQIATKGCATVFISIGLAEEHSKNRVKSSFAKYDFFIFKLLSFMDSAWKLEGASLHLEKVSCT